MRSTFLHAAFVVWLCFGLEQTAFGQTPPPQARVTRIFNDVKLMPSQADARPAVLNDIVDENTGVRTGDDSRSELTLGDLTITRLGANTIYSFNNAGRSVQLENGSILFYARKGSGGAQLGTDTVTVGITGTTVILEITPDSKNALTVLEGKARISLNQNPSESALVYAGERLVVPAGATKLPPPLHVDVQQIMQSDPLIVGFSPLPSQSLILENSLGQGVRRARPKSAGLPSGPFIPPQSTTVNPSGPPPMWPGGGSSMPVSHPKRKWHPTPTPTPRRSSDNPGRSKMPGHPTPTPTPRRSQDYPGQTKTPSHPKPTPTPTPSKRVLRRFPLAKPTPVPGRGTLH